MIIFTNKEFSEKIFYVLFYAFLTAGIMSPIAVDGFIPALADYINHLAEIIQAKMAMTEGQFPLRVAPLDQSGWGYPYFQFYSPTTYTLAGLIYKWFTPHNPIMALKTTIWGSLIISGIYMNRLCYWFIRIRPIALLASVVYLTSPYFISVINNFCDLSEILGLSLAPVALFYTFKRYTHPQTKNLIQTGLVWYLLITVHSVTFIYCASLAIFILILLTLKNPHHWKNCLQAVIGLGFACLLAMWYLAPINLFGKYILISQTFAKAETFQHYAPVLSQLLFPGGSQFKKELIYNHPAIGWTSLLSVGVCTYAFFHQFKIQSNRFNLWLPALLISFYLTFLLIWSPINFWQWIPEMFRIGQYSWRLQGQLNWIGALLFAWAVAYLFPHKLDLKHVVIGIVLIVLLSNQWFPTLNNSNLDIAKFKKNPYFVYNQNAYSINFNKNTSYVDSIDTMILYSLMAHNTLQIGLPYYIPKSLLALAKAPYVSIEGVVKENIKPTEISAIIDEQPIAKKTVTQGPFYWDIPLDHLLTQFHADKSFILKFSMPTNNKISVSKVVLMGFLNKQTTMPLATTQKYCKRIHARTECTISVDKPTDLIELPVLYYPQLLKITLNKEIIPYQSIVYKDYLLTGIKPVAGLNQIEVEFRGLVWANWVSLLSWGLLGLLMIMSWRGKRNLFC